MAIIVSKKGENAQKIEKQGFDKEDYLQNYIHNNPELIPVYEIEEDKRLFVVAREFSTESGPIDALAIDKDGDIYIVETKLYKNPDKRTVVAQALDYGAALWKHLGDFTEFVSRLDNETQKKFNMGFQQKIKEFFNLEDDETQTLLESMRRNLNEGNLKFVILMDEMDERLKDLIIYVNQNSQFDIFAVQLEYYKFEEYEIMIPKIFGVEVRKEVGVSSSIGRRKWDETSFFEDAKLKLKDKQLGAVKELYDFSKATADQITWGTGATRSSFNVKFSDLSNKSLYTVYSDGRLAINFGWLNDNKTAEKYRDKLKDELEKIPGLTIPQNYQDIFPHFRVEHWAPLIDKFISAVKQLLRK